MKKKLIILMVLMTFIFTQGFTQSKLFKDIEVTVENSDMIYNSNTGELLGYYYFYKIDKVSAKEGKFVLSILNTNLEEIFNKEIITGISNSLTTVKFDGEYLMTMEADNRNYVLIKKYYKNDGSLSKTETIKDFDNSEILNFSNPIFPNPLITYNVENGGFLELRPITKTRSAGFQLSYTDANTKGNLWTYETGMEKKVRKNFKLIYATKEQIIYRSTVSKGSAFNPDMTEQIIAIDTKSGKEKWKFEKTFDKRNYLTFECAYDINKDEINLIGTYLTIEKVNNFDFKEIYLCKIDKNGNVIKEVKKAWDEWNTELSKEELNYFDNTRRASFTYPLRVNYNNVVLRENGGFFVVAEKGKPNQLGYGVYSAMASEIMYLYQFNKDFQLEKIYQVDKPKKPEAKNYLDQTAAKNQGNFQSITVKKGEDTAFMKYFTQSSNKEYLIAYAVLHNDKINYKEMKIEKDKDLSVTILPAKTGYILVEIYNSDEKSLELRLEKIDY